MARTTPVNSGYTIINGTATGSNASHVDCWLEYKITSQDVTNNFSVIDVYLYSASTDSSSTKWTTAENFGYVGYNNGNKAYRSTTYDFSNKKVNCFGHSSFSVSHNADGTKTITLQGAWSTSHSSYISGGSVSASVTLTTIPRATAPTLSASSVAFNSSVTITMNRASSSFTHTLTYSCGSASGTIGTDLGTSKAWTVPNSLMSQIPSATSAKITIACKTYSGSTLIGTKTVTLTATVPSSIVPTISTIRLTDPNNLAATYGGYVQNKSKLKVEVDCAGVYGSTITNVSITALGKTATTNPYTSVIITDGQGSKTVSVTITDSRGRTASSTASFTVLAYSSPTISSMTAIRCNSSGTADDEGTYIKVTYTFAIASLNSKNTKSAVTEYRSSAASTYSNADTYTGAYSGTRSFVFGAGGISVDSAYNVKLTVSDAFTSTTKNVDVPSAFVVIDFRSTGKGMAVGQVSSKDRFQVGMETELNKNVYLSPDNDTEKNILFQNTGNGTYTHRSKLYGGNGSSTTAIGLYDYLNSRNILVYNDVTNKLHTAAVLKQHFIRVGLASETTLSTTNETTLAMKTILSEQDASGILSVSGNGILCSADGFIQVSGAVYYTTGVITNGLYLASIKKNGSTVVRTLMRSAGTYNVIPISPTFVSVSAGDIITLVARSQSGSGAVVNNENFSTMLSVMYVG